MKELLLTTIALLCALIGLTQTITVKDIQTNERLAYATIYSDQTTTTTDLKGQADISVFNENDSIYITRLGYETSVYTYQEIKEASFHIYMEPTQFITSEVVVSVTKWSQEKGDLPNRVATIKKADVLLQNPQTAADMLHQSGQVYVQKSQLGGGSPMIRGFAANRLLISVDGIRMNTAIFRSGNLQNIISLDVFSTERAEVVFGPGSVIYGSDALGGVMSFYSLTPQFSEKNTAVSGSGLIRYASANFEKTAHFDINIARKKWSFLTSVTFSDYDDLRMGNHGPEEYLRTEYVASIDGVDSIRSNKNPRQQISTGYNQYNILQKIAVKPSENVHVEYGFYYSQSSNIPRYDRLIQYRNGLPRDGTWYYGPQTWMMHALHTTYKKKTRAFDQVRMSLAYQQFKESRHNRGYKMNLLANRYERVHVFSLNWDAEKRFTDKHQLFYGIEGLFNQVESNANEENILTEQTAPLNTRYPDGSLWSSYASYVNYIMTVHPKVTFQSGIRYTGVVIQADFDTSLFSLPVVSVKQHHWAVNGGLGIAYKPGKQWQLTTNLSTGFRAPNIDDVGKVFDSEPGSVVVPNTALTPEYAYSAELGMSKVFDNVARVYATGFYTWLDNAFIRRNFTLNGQDSILYEGVMSQVQAVQNASQAQVYGVQTGLEIHFGKGLRATSQFSYQKGIEKDEWDNKVPLRHATPFFGSNHVIYSRKGYTADAYIEYSGKVDYEDLAPSEQNKPHIYAIDNNGNPYSPGWYTLNLKMRYRINNHFLVNVGLENITNRRYRMYSSGIVAPGINFMTSLSVTF